MSTKISIITLSCRPDGLKIVERALSRQTEKSFEWIIGSPTKPSIKLDHIWVKDPPKPRGLYWQVYRQYNECLRHANSPLIVSFQDYTYCRPDTLQRFYDHYELEPKTIVGAHGDKYVDETWTVKTWEDPRPDNGYQECQFTEIELNLAAFPKQAFYDVGGFDEWLDRYSSLCGLDVLDRLNRIGGWKFKIDTSIKSFSLEHGRLPKWEEFNPLNNGVWEEHRKEYIDNPKLKYLIC